MFFISIVAAASIKDLKGVDWITRPRCMDVSTTACCKYHVWRELPLYLRQNIQPVRKFLSYQAVNVTIPGKKKQKFWYGCEFDLTRIEDFNDLEQLYEISKPKIRHGIPELSGLSGSSLSGLSGTSKSPEIEADPIDTMTLREILTAATVSGVESKCPARSYAEIVDGIGFCRTLYYGPGFTDPEPSTKHPLQQKYDKIQNIMVQVKLTQLYDSHGSRWITAQEKDPKTTPIVFPTSEREKVEEIVDFLEYFAKKMGREYKPLLVEFKDDEEKDGEL